MFVIAATDTDEVTTVGSTTYLIVAICVFVIIVTILLGVLVTVARKRVRGTTWFPEGFFNSLKGAVGGESPTWKTERSRR